MFLEMCGKLSFCCDTWVVCPCLADGNKLRQLFTNLLSSSPFSPLYSLFKKYVPQNWMCDICPKCPPEKPSFPLFGWKRGKGTRHCFHFNRRRHAWLSRVSQKIGSFGARCESERKLMCIWEKSRGEDFIGVKSLIFESGCQSNWTTAGSKTPAVFVPCSVYPFWL